MAPNIKKRVLVGTPMFVALIGLFFLDSVAAQYGLGGLPPLILGWILISKKLVLPKFEAVDLLVRLVRLTFSTQSYVVLH